MASTNIKQVNRKMLRVFSGKIWLGRLNLVPADEEAVKAMDQMLDYVEMLQTQVKGLERKIFDIRGET